MRLPVLAGLILPLPVAVDPVPSCAGPMEMTNVAVARVEKNGDLSLKDGRIAVLEGVRLPLRDGAPPALAQEVLRSLRELTATPLTLAAPGEDRYQRLGIQAFGAGWLQAELLRRGLARVAIAPGRQDCAPELYKAEQEARDAKRGLWAYPAFAIRKAAAVPISDTGTFQIVEGMLVNGARHDGRIFLDFSQDYRHGFSAIVAPEDVRLFRRLKPESLAGRVIRLRGVIEEYDGKAEILLSNPGQIEFIN
ncbi:MAG TPA: thermonuclease family protein [Rhizomicrobium sp.]|nr:thermonuclease family protein [Rhizomicrobium sp.]